MTPSELEAEFRARCANGSSNLLLLPTDDALELVRRARSLAIPILGIEAMIVDAKGVLPLLDHIADYSSAEQGNGCWNIAESFISDRRAQGMVFAVTLGEALT